MQQPKVLLLLITILSLFTLISTLPTSQEPTGPPLSRPNEVAARYCSALSPAKKTCRVLTLAHGTTTGTIVDMDIYSPTCTLIGSARSQSYSKKAKVLTSLTNKNWKNCVTVRPEGMQGIMTPEVTYAGKEFGNDRETCELDRDLGGWVCVVDFEC
ncbi:uncharacterized protein RAG0_14462 [Rhynchosporium agropyri]|uniref:Uncharacterized protein n=1 Tax=Rhynchosporium agropyri TaxID=914238 RepID=A0A1E1LH49_9HELO|nr:uncharacterized protein RAG0_14462 [Rhynchosporium agropyri]